MNKKVILSLLLLSSTPYIFTESKDVPAQEEKSVLGKVRDGIKDGVDSVTNFVHRLFGGKN